MGGGKGSNPLRRFVAAPPEGEPLAKRRSFPVCQGLPSVGEVARRRRDGEVESSSGSRSGSPSSNLSVGLAPASSPSRGASGEEAKLSGMPKPPLGRSNGDDRRQRRKQGGAVGAAASRMQATAQQTLGAATRAVAMRSIDGEVIPLFCKNPLQTSPRCGIIHLAASPLRIEYLPL